MTDQVVYFHGHETVAFAGKHYSFHFGVMDTWDGVENMADIP